MEMKTTKHNFFSRGIAVLLSVLMCFGAFSMTAFAIEDTSADTPQATTDLSQFALLQCSPLVQSLP